MQGSQVLGKATSPSALGLIFIKFPRILSIGSLPSISDNATSLIYLSQSSIWDGMAI
jgi:hypothetical protein